MRVEIISVGDELLIGQTINTNASWIGDKLLNTGVQVQWVTTVGDEKERLSVAIRTIWWFLLKMPCNVPRVMVKTAVWTGKPLAMTATP